MIYKVGDKYTQANNVSFVIVEVLDNIVATRVDYTNPADEFKGLYWYTKTFLDSLHKQKLIKKIGKKK